MRCERRRALRHRPAITCEVHRMQEGDEDRLERMLQAHGYERSG